MNIENLTALLGKVINNPNMVNFLEENGFNYPKKDTISNRKKDKTDWLVNKKLKIDLLFSIKVYNENFKAAPCDKKDLFYPILTSIRIYGDAINLPYGIVLKKETTYDEMVSNLGNPTLKSSDVAKIWLNDDGSES